jgi:hypothetical protein
VNHFTVHVRSYRSLLVLWPNKIADIPCDQDYFHDRTVSRSSHYLLCRHQPGPDFAMVSRNSLLLSRRSGVLTALGIGAGVCVHVTYTLLGVGLLIQQSLWLFNLIKLAGAAYLIFLGIKMLRAKPATDEEASVSLPSPAWGAAHRISDQCAQSQDHHLHRQPLHAGGAAADAAGGPDRLWRLHRAGHALWFSAVALFFSTDSVRDGLLAVRHWIDRVFGGCWWDSACCWH